MQAGWPVRLRAIIAEFEGGNQAAFARKLALSKQAVSKLLGGAVPSGATLEQLVRSYPTVNLEYLLTGRGPVRDPGLRSGVAHERGAAEVVGRLEGFVRELRERYGEEGERRAIVAPVIPSKPPSDEEGRERA